MSNFSPRPLYLYCTALVLFFFSTGTLRAASIDDDLDGLSDVWEAAYGTGLVPSDDADGDGKTNLEESIAGTDPTDVKSRLHVESFNLAAGNVAQLRWPSVAGKSYYAQTSFDLIDWQNIGLPVIGTGATAEMTLPLATTFLTGKVAISRWTNVATNFTLVTLRNNITNNVAPSETGFVTSVETPQTSPDQSYYGQWIRGWIIPPTTGTYTFWIASDDASELWLSTSSDPLMKQKIANVTGLTFFRQWTKTASQQSTARALTANQPYYFEVLQRESTGGDHVSVAWTGPGFATQTVIDGRYLTNSPIPISQIAPVKSFFRITTADIDTDSDGVSNADESLIGYNPDSATTIPRVADGVSIRSALAAQNVVTVGTPDAHAYEANLHQGRLTFSRSGNLDPLNIQYSVSGTAVVGVDYAALNGTVYLPVGQTSVSVDVTPLVDADVETPETVVVEVVPGASYQAGSPGAATVTIDDAPDVLFVANLRPDPSVRSGGYGTAALNIAGNEISSTFSVSFGNLLALQVQTQLYISNGGVGGTSVLDLPAGQISARGWNFDATTDYSRDDILLAIEEGRLYARVTSTLLPGGEIFGQFSAEAGWQQMPVPPAPPALPGGNLNESDASRFLVQATFGPTEADINHLQNVGLNNWLNEQISTTPTLHLPYVQYRQAELLAASNGLTDGAKATRQEAWWQATLAGPDQLRQRMAFALSEIFVISEVGVLDGSHAGVTSYYDLLVENAFGNYRDLLEKVTLSPLMGQYLSMARNQKPNPVTGAEPDENYARECMQLFSIGLNQLNQDGSLKLGPTGMPIPTYTQADIVGLAHLFTGWAFKTPQGATPNFLYGGKDEMHPMEEFPAYHDMAQKNILNHTVVPAGQTMSQDLRLALDTIFNHPNVGPFISRQLIQRFVTSNPSPGYIYRVAAVFNNNGSGVRGDLKATLKAVLLDYEARSTDMLTDAAHGKLKEPLIRMAHLLRSMKVAPPKPRDSRFFLDPRYTLATQVALASPSVFNFFQPGYMPPGVIATNGLYAPEFQIASASTVLGQDNNQHAAIFLGLRTTEKDANGQYYFIKLDVSQQAGLLNRLIFSILDNQNAMIDNLDLLLLNGRMSAGLRQNLLTGFSLLPPWFTTTQNQTDRVNMAIWHIMASPEYCIQK